MHAQLLNTNKIGKAICTGENQSPDLKAYQQEILESELTQLVILSNTGDSSKVSLLKKGTSTFEESEAILAYCIANNIQNCAVISSAFHTRRIKYVFSDKFKAKGINVYIYGAPSSIYDEYAWWKSENGLIALNNEYIKYAYYLLK